MQIVSFFLFLNLGLSYPLASAQTLTSSNLPIVSINTNGQVIPDEPKIVAGANLPTGSRLPENMGREPFGLAGCSNPSVWF